MRSQRPESKKEQSEKLENDVEAFLAGGGDIHPVQVWENRWYQDKGDVRCAPLTITQKQNAHRWRNHRNKPNPTAG